MAQQGTLVFERSETSTGHTRRRRPRYVATAKEADVLAGCLELLRLRGIPHWRANSGAATLHRPDGSHRFVRFGVVGQSDILGIIPSTGRLLAVEAKAPGGQLSTAQTAFLEMIHRAGGVAIVAHDAAELAEALDRTNGQDHSRVTPLEALRAAMTTIRSTDENLVDVSREQGAKLLQLLEAAALTDRTHCRVRSIALATSPATARGFHAVCQALACLDAEIARRRVQEEGGQ